MIESLLRQGLEAHRAGRWAEAKTFYEQALKIDPRHPDALHLAGVAALQGGQADLAIARIEKAVAAQPRHAGFLGNLAQAYLAADRVAEARTAFLRAAALEPGAPQFAMGAANCLAAQGQLEPAERELRGLLERYPRFALGWLNLAHVLRELGRLEEAAVVLARVLELDPAQADAHAALGTVMQRLERLDEAERAYRRFLAARPDSLPGHCNLAFVLVDQGKFAEAATACRQALARGPASAELHTIMGTALAHGGRMDEARSAFRAALAIDPQHLRAAWGHGYALVDTGEPRAGVRELEGVVARHPDAPELRDSLSLVRLSLGDLQRGWEDYRSRAVRLQFMHENPALPLAEELPADLQGAQICLLREQGPGDELFFLRFAQGLKSRGATLIYQAHPKLASLLARAGALDRIIAKDERPPQADAVVLVGDLPRLLGRYPTSALMQRESGHTGERAPEYPLALRVFHPELPPPFALASLPDRLAQMADRLRRLGPPPYIGITWRAGTPPAEQRGTAWVLHKEIALEALADGLRGTRATWISLQRNARPGEVDSLASCLNAAVHDFDELNDDLEAMLALLSLLDDYVGVSNTNMHLRAGAGRPARTLVPRPAEWRWLTSGSESPWFPGFRIYRQGRDGSWGAPLAALSADLRAAHGGPPGR